MEKEERERKKKRQKKRERETIKRNMVEKEWSCNGEGEALLGRLGAGDGRE